MHTKPSVTRLSVCCFTRVFITSVFYEYAYAAFPSTVIGCVAGVISATILVATNLSYWIKLCLRVSPILAIAVVIASAYAVGRLWKKYSTDVNSTLIRIALIGIHCFQNARFDFLSFNDSFIPAEQLKKKRKTRRILQMMGLFCLAQAHFEPKSHNTALFSLFFCSCVESLACVFYKLFKDGTYPQYCSPSVPAYLRRIIDVCFVISKASVCFGIAWYQLHVVSSSYIFVTMSYYILSFEWIERQCSAVLEHFQFEVFEGLEPHYVAGCLSAVRIVYALYFMLMALMERRQFLMLFALCTNVYTGSRELISSNLALALTEWKSMAKFEKASRQELQRHDDVCPVCLSRMNSARKTQCGHLFHGHCLRRCLKQRSCCPLCLQSVRL